MSTTLAAGGYDTGAINGPARIPIDSGSLHRQGPPFAVMKFPGLLDLVAQQNTLAWQPFRPGVEIFPLYSITADGRSAALIRFQAGARVSLHEHTGFEHILVLSGSQRDESGTAATGTLIVNTPGSAHSITSDTGCIVLAIYEKPVRFIETGDAAQTA